VYVIERADDGSYRAYLPDLPGCATSGDSPEQVEGQLPEAVELYLSYYQQRGLPPPPPRGWKVDGGVEAWPPSTEQSVVMISYFLSIASGAIQQVRPFLSNIRNTASAGSAPCVFA
jgi:predicted RNase H-like HicB family nuclease